MSDANLGTISGRIELDDQFSSKLDRIIEGISSLDEKTGGFGARFIEMTTSFFSAETALEAVKEGAHLTAEAIEEVIEKGSRAADVRDAFQHLAEGAHLGVEAIENLRAATHGQIDDFDLMERVNRNLSSGLNLTSEQMDTLGKGAYALSKVQGIDLKDAFDRVSDAMVTGRTRAIQLLTGRIDQTAAEEKFADALGTTTDHLNEAGKIEAIRTVILDKLGDVTERVGQTHDRLADKVEKVKVAYEDFEQKLAMSIADSPAIVAGFDAITGAVEDAFGANQAQLIDTITKKVDEGAIAVLDFAQDSMTGGKLVVETWHEVENTYQAVVAGIQAITYEAESGIAALLKADQALGGNSGLKTSIDAVNADMDRLYDSMAQHQAAVEANQKSDAAWSETFDGLSAAIKNVQDKMKAANDTSKEGTVDLDAVRTSLIALQSAHDKIAPGLDKTDQYTKETSEDLKKEQTEVDKTAVAWNQYDDLIAKRAGAHSLEAQRADVEKWADDQIQKLDYTTDAWQEHYDAIEAIAAEKLDEIGIDTNKLYQGSREMRQDDFNNAQKTYTEALANANNYSQEFLQKLRDDRDAAKNALILYGHESVAQLNTIQSKAEETAASVWAITPPITMMLDKLDKASFDKLGGYQRFDSLNQLYQQDPGRKAGGSGSTGLASNDESGYIAMLQEQRDYEQLKTYIDAHPQNDPTTAAGQASARSVATNSTNAVVGSTVTNSGNITNNFTVNGNATDVANQIADIFMKRLGTRAQFSGL